MMSNCHVEALTRSNPHPDGINARMHTTMSRNCMSTITTRVINTATDMMKITPLIIRNTSWKLALNFRRPTDTACTKELNMYHTKVIKQI